MVSDDIMMLLTPRRERMKRAVILVLVLVAVILPVAGKTNLINIGYNVHGAFWDYDDLRLRSVGVDYIHLGGDTFGFYFQANPYYSTSFKNSSGTVYKLSENEQLGFGSNFLIGIGGDINFGSMGIILGGGLFADMNYYNWQYADYYMFTLSSGLGAGVNFYYHVGAGDFVINAGFTAAWRPWTYWFDETDSGTETINGQTNVNFNIGIGWRTGGIGSKTAKSSSSGNGSDDW
jgi:hypothetical protein